MIVLAQKGKKMHCVVKGGKKTRPQTMMIFYGPKIHQRKNMETGGGFNLVTMYEPSG